MAKQKSTFNAILYEVGDEVISIYNNDPRNASNFFRSKAQTILFTKETTIGTIPTQLIMFENSTEWEVSNHYKPYGNTIKKYDDGLNMINKTPTIITTFKTKVSTKNTIDKIQKEINEVEVFRFKLPKREKDETFND